MFITIKMPKDINCHLFGIRNILVIFVVTSISLPMAWISFAKILLIFGGLLYLIRNGISGVDDKVLERSFVVRAILVTLSFFALSTLWSNVDIEVSVWAFLKHAKLIEIVLIIYLIRNFSEARLAISSLLFCQSIIIIISWLMVAGFEFPFSAGSSSLPVVFSESYIDQSLMFVAAAGLLWNLRAVLFWPKWISIILMLMALINVFLFMPSRTGFFAGLASIVISLYWNFFKNCSILKRVIVLIFLLLTILAALFLVSKNFHDRSLLVLGEIKNYAIDGKYQNSSAGWRLNTWLLSSKAFLDSPLIGYGVGSWRGAVRTYQNDYVDEIGVSEFSNPHQEFLLWIVELGAIGIFCIGAIIFSVVKDSYIGCLDARRALILILTVIMIACFMNSALFDDLIGDYFCITLGVTLSLCYRCSRHKLDH